MEITCETCGPYGDIHKFKVRKQQGKELFICLECEGMLDLDGKMLTTPLWEYCEVNQINGKFDEEFQESE